MKHSQHDGNRQAADDGPGQRRVGFAASAKFQAAIGINPNSVASDVINTGRKRTRQANETASRSGRPSARSRLVNSTMRMLLETTMPTIITTPINDMTLSVVPVANRMISTPVKPVGTASKINSGSRNDLNCATRIK